MIEHTLWGDVDKVEVAIGRLRMFEPPEGYYLAFSGGLDSCVLKALADMAGVKYDAHYSLTTVDPPELVRFIREQHPDVAVDKPERSMWELIVKEQYPPTMIQRYCCKHLKERGGVGRIVLTGIRAEESAKRAKRGMVEACYRVRKSYVHPIIDWTRFEEWQFVRARNLPYCSLYDEGFDRIGCIMCPFERRTKKERDIARWPKYYAAYVRAFDRMVEARNAAGKRCDWQNGQDVMDWWLSEAQHVPDEQMEMFA